jgi:hypothetical protein
MKKFLFLICFSISMRDAAAQQLKGVVQDEATHLPIAGAQVIHQDQVVLTNTIGEFTLPSAKNGDQVSFRLMGYETRELKVNALDLKAELTIYLKTKVINLSAVNIRSQRNNKLDSIRLRKEFAAVFNAKGPKITDMFVKINPEERFPLALVKPPSTASIVSFNALNAISIFGKKKKRISKLKSTLLAKEADNYVNQRFSKLKIQAITALPSDSLSLFVERFRPSATDLKQMNDYQLLVYIKKSYAEWIKP